MHGGHWTVETQLAKQVLKMASFQTLLSFYTRSFEHVFLVLQVSESRILKVTSFKFITPPFVCL